MTETGGGREAGNDLDADHRVREADRRSAAEYAALETRMAESEARAWQLLQAVPDPIVVTDAAGIIELINAQAVALLGYQPDELIGQPVERLIPATLHGAHRRHRTAYIATDEPSPMSTGPNIVAVRKDGSLVPVEVNLSAIMLSTGRALLASIHDVSERKRSEAESRISEERFRASFDRAAIGMALIDLRRAGVGRFLRVNGALCAMTGYSEIELLATTSTAITHPDDRVETASNLNRLADGTDTRWTTDKRYQDAAGQAVWVHFAVSVVHDAGGAPSYGVSQVEDITVRKHGEAQLQERFRELATNVDVGFLVRQLDPPEFLYFNPAYMRIFGFDPAGPAPTPRDAIALVNPDDVERVRAILAAAAGGDSVEHTWRFTRRDGKSRWVSGRFSPITDLDGKVRRVAGLFEDITDRRCAEVVLAESEERFRELANNVDVGFSIREPGNSAYLYLNSEYQTIFGFDPAAPWPTLDQVVARIHPADGHRRTNAPVVPDDRTTDEWRLLLPGGVERWISGNTFPVLDDDGHTRRVVGIIEDITERKATENAMLAARAEAERANAAKTEFLSAMSHELRTPLNAILGFGQLIEMDDPSSQRREWVGHILKSGHHLLGLIDEILDISRMESGTIRLSLEPVHVGDVVAQTVGMLAPLADQRGIRIEVDDSGMDNHVFADHQRLKQVLVNILSNALKYNLTNGSVRIECETTAERLLMSVTDTGIGIADHDLNRLFQPFERLSAEQSTIEGTGLGLALTKRLMTEMGGEVGVRSSIGEGSSFWLKLPIIAAAVRGREMPQMVADRPPTPLRRKTVLYVEDNVSNVRLLEQIVARRPEVELLVAMQGQIGLDMARMHQPDLILLDLHLPDISGEDVLRRLRSDTRTATTMIVVLSADATNDQPKRLLALGASDYLTKPFDIPSILDLIDRLEPV